MKQNITTFLWFDENAKEAVDFYASVFKDSKITDTMYYPKSAEEGLADFQKDMAGKELVISFELNGQKFAALNGGQTDFHFSEAISFAVGCSDQEEIDYFWEKLSSVPEAEQCGWCKDKFGVSWQIVPDDVNDLLKKPNAFKNMMQMKKLVIADF
jgi:predicted 3-demethylubiquinone-9 3-methyltransferase (glyoxalase superfamily)